MEIIDIIISIMAQVSPIKIVLLTISLALILWTKAYIAEWQKDKQEKRRKADIEWFISQRNKSP
ncbi:hypothetical protein SAMN05661096_03605 [Marivirga sericea]|uniref:Uncharacterized protein n=1 Tax=Marivirga sericea TaxID=1028 RepID=A0A1X7L7F7_9BACT|nr:hypothetical protein SAMN05661096_03605 [Marivirga sericea]